MNVLTLIVISALFSPTLTSTHESWSFGEYKLETVYPAGPGLGYRILKDNEEVFSASPGAFRIISVSHGRQVDPAQPTATDITGDRVPDLIIEDLPQEPGCCFAYSVYSLGPKSRQIGRITGFPSPMTFEDINRDSVYEITGEDWTFGSWYANAKLFSVTFAESIDSLPD